MGKRSGFSAEEKLEAVLTLLRKKDTVAKIARLFSVSENTLYKWREQFLESGKSGLRSGVSSEQKRVRELEKEVPRREQLIGELTVANRILRKRGRLDLGENQRESIKEEAQKIQGARLNKILELIGVPRSSWYYKAASDEKKKKRKGDPQAKPVPEHIVETVPSTAMTRPWYGYKKIAVTRCSSFSYAAFIASFAR